MHYAIDDRHMHWNITILFVSARVGVERAADAREVLRVLSGGFEPALVERLLERLLERMLGRLP